MAILDYGRKSSGFIGKMLAEFRDFAFKGNMIDLAVAVVLGAAFGQVINAIVKDIIMPIIGYVDFRKGGGYEYWHIGRIMIGPVLAELLNFVIVAMAVFLVIVKLVGLLMKSATLLATKQKADEAAAPTTRECPYCCSVIPIKASKCAHCTSDLPAPAAAVANG